MKMPDAVAIAFVARLFAVSPATAQICGDNVRDVGEQCDDGANHNLDGCDASCQFEQTHRVIDLRLQRVVNDPVCMPNVFGGAFNAFAAGQTNNAIATTVENGTTSILLHFLGLDDVTGVTNDSALEVGILSSTPVLPGAIPYDGNATTDLDWWYTPDEHLLDSERLPANRLAGSIAGGAITTLEGEAELNFVLAGSPTSFSLSALVLGMPTAAPSTPLVSSSGFPPGHLSAEHLDPALESFSRAGNLAGFPAVPTATMCGNVTAISIENTAIPPALSSCNEAYTAGVNTLLDVMVGGCTVPIFGQLITPVQPDEEDSTVDPVGAGHPYTLTADLGTKRVTSCTAVGGGSVALADCLRDAAYSTYFKFTSQRVIARDDLIFVDGFEDTVI